MIHPTGMHVCQCCGESRSVFYEYPTLRTLEKLCKLLSIVITKQTDYTIREIIEKFCNTNKKLFDVAKYLGMGIPSDKDQLIKQVYEELVSKNSSRFSPGVMCNPPDRFNGFHSYALCCRKEKDTGRHDENMKTYTQDRRAYEEWSDGDYNLANRIMGEFHKAAPMKCPMCHQVAEMTADHIGPISLGFCHSRYFTPLCKSCNSAKNNRFTYDDVNKLIDIEASGGQVISWHSKYIWDMLKKQIHNDKDARKASSIMVKCHQNILYILALINKENGKEFLMQYLHPEFSLMDYRFMNFDLSDLSKMVVLASPLESKNKLSNQERYIRVAFESLDDFLTKDNRKNNFILDANSPHIEAIIRLVHQMEYGEADRLLKETLKEVSAKIYEEEWIPYQDDWNEASFQWL